MMQALTVGMMERLGIRSTTAMSPPEDVTSELSPSSLSSDYEELITECLHFLGLSPDQVRISVRPVGVNAAGLDVYAAFVKVVRWDPAVIKAMTRMPYIEKKIERRIRLSDVLRYSAFAGLWFRSPSSLEGLGKDAAVH
ncbi:MAG: hypothetical protein KF871_06350 [Hydrogenophaga sp.]|uniref:hypothetical protein n=1 Tax=Hydrogenophaga sp. TaxID=1904254 RepID=UPI001D2A716C|nr:hypothetical protein [Hydrogenophaga sp.]MBX3609502.1 hypothetical protein [Hydrogenophaga sp.]